MKVKEIQEQGNINLQLKNKKKVQKLKEKGITLIALVVTIIILLILSGVTLNMALSGDGLFSRARNAADKYKKAQEEEQKLISQIGKEMNDEYIGAYISGYEPTSGTCTITKEQSGIEEQEFSTANETKLKWKIWDYDGTILRIILDEPTTQKLKLSGTSGYNNGVWAINEVCRKCFGKYKDENNSKDMETGIDVANLRRSDIEAVSNYDYTKFKHKPTGNDGYKEVIGNDDNKELIYYGDMETYTENFHAPLIWEKYDKNWTYKYDKENKTSTGDKNIEVPWEQEFEQSTAAGNTDSSTKFVQSYYRHDYKDKEEEFKNPEYYEMLFRNEDGKLQTPRCWLSTRSVIIYKVKGCNFDLCSTISDMRTCLVTGSAVYTSTRRWSRGL